jgi:hypothetical protein
MFWNRTNHKNGKDGGSEAGSGNSRQVSPEQLQILREISSPWCLAARELASGRVTPRRVERAFRRAFRGLTRAQVAEYHFAIGIPVAESRALLTRGREEFSKAALAFAESKISPEALSSLVVDDGALIILTIVQQVRTGLWGEA